MGGKRFLTVWLAHVNIQLDLLSDRSWATDMRLIVATCQFVFLTNGQDSDQLDARPQTCLLQCLTTVFHGSRAPS